MSEAASALDGVTASGTIEVVESGLQGMITLRGDLSDESLTAALAKAAGVEIPAPRQVTSSDAGQMLWMSPDELMLLCPHDEAEVRVAAISAALAGQHHMAVNVSDARAYFRLTGEGAAIREVLAKISPADMRDASLPVGEARRTRLAQVAGAFWFSADGEAHLICFRSVAQYVFDLLKISSASGSDVGHF